MSKIFNALELLPKEKMGRNEPCWCLSGKKWKECHRGREDQRRVNSFKAAEILREEYARGYCCLHPNASPTNCSEIIKAHTIQKKGGLAAIANSNHVISIKKAFSELPNNKGSLIPSKLGINNASTFPGFCSTHDNSMFEPIENDEFCLSHETAFLLFYRAIAYELFQKESSLRSYHNFKELDKGLPFVEQCRIQSLLNSLIQGSMMGLRNMQSLKEKLCEIYKNVNFSEVQFYAVRLSGVLPIVCCGAFFPEYDFCGKYLGQELGTNKILETVSLNITSWDGSSYIVLAWIGNNDPAKELAFSFRGMLNKVKANAALIFAFEYLENVYMRPSWWEKMREDDKQILIKYACAGLPFRNVSHPAINFLKSSIEFVSNEVEDEVWVVS